MENRIVFIALLLVTGIAGVFYFLFPRISRRGLLFGVYVGEEASKSEEAHRITRSWYSGMALWLAASVAGAFCAVVVFRSVPGAVAGVCLLSIGFLEEYLRAYVRSRRLAGEGPPPDSAAFIAVERPAGLWLPWLAIAAGFACGTFAIYFAWSHYGEIPARVPTHFGFAGAPDAWKPRSVSTVFLPSVLTLVMGMGMGGMALLIGHAKRAIRSGDRGVSFAAQQRFRRAMANFLAIISLLLSAMLTLLSVSSIRVALKQSAALAPAFMFLTLVLVVFALGGSIYIALRYGQGGSQLEKSVADAPLTNGLADNRRWVLGMFYVNRDDPSIFVERRFGLGYTINFGNPRALAFLAGFVGLILVILVIARITD